MEQYIQIYILYLQDDQIDWLIFTKFITNNSVLEIIKVFPFLANYSQYPQMGFKPLSNTSCPAYQALQIAKADRFVKKIKELQQFFTNEIIWAQSVYKAVINKKRTLVLVY